MRIGEVARCTGLSVDTLRFYEKRGLLTDAHFERMESGYRKYNKAAIERLRLIKGTQAAGFTLNEIGMLFERWEANELTSREIAAQLTEKCNEIAAKIAELQQVQVYLEQKICAVTGVSVAQ